MCVKVECSIKEALTAQSATAQACNRPVRNKQPMLRAVVIPFLVVATLFYVARIAARLPKFGGEFGADDYMISAAYLLALGYSIVLMLLASAGLGKDIWNVPFGNPIDQVTYTLKLFIALEKTYILTVWCTKISILLLYLRIFPDSKFRTNVKLAIAFCAATAFCLFFACLFKCWPINYSWTYWDGEHHGSCSSQNAQGWANAGLNIFGDILVLVLPLPTIWRMTVSKSKRFGIMFMFGVGIFITLVSMIRLYTLKIFSFSENPTWDFVGISLWSMLEVDAGIMCACLPGARNFYNRVICGKILGKGRFATDPPRVGSAGPLKREMSERGQHPCHRSESAASNESDATAVGVSDSASTKSVILVISDVDIDIEDRRMSAMSADRFWIPSEYAVEEWPVSSRR